MTHNFERPPRFVDHEYPQVIPEPDDIRHGAPAPWSLLALERRQGFALDLVVSRMRASGRTFDVSSMPAEPVEMVGVADGAYQLITRKSAVLVALFEEDGETHVILTRRSLELSSHRGEIALPGGRSDADETPIDTALREAEEEVGLAPSLVEPVGWLSPIVTFASGSAIWPVVAILEGRPTLVADPAEVERVFTIPLSSLVSDDAFLEERWRREGLRPGVDEDGYFPIYFFQVPGDVVWGATARVLTELLCVVVGVEWPDAHRLWS
jgi:8-oxo-dGTP pyrophosphatase MutT (NUDIX family)